MRCPTCKGRGSLGDRLGPRLKALREGRGWSQAELGGMLSDPVSGSTIGRWENEQAEPGIYQALELANLFGIDIVDFITPAKRGSHGGDGQHDHGSEAPRAVDAARGENSMDEGDGSAGGIGREGEAAEGAAEPAGGGAHQPFETLN